MLQDDRIARSGFFYCVGTYFVDFYQFGVSPSSLFRPTGFDLAHPLRPRLRVVEQLISLHESGATQVVAGQPIPTVEVFDVSGLTHRDGLDFRPQSPEFPAVERLCTVTAPPEASQSRALSSMAQNTWEL